MNNTLASYREITASAVILGVIQGVLMTAAFTYIGLKLGFTLGGSTVAAILGFALLRGIGRGVLHIDGAGSIIENNINQTIASGINTASAGVVFTFPALLLLGQDFNVWTIIISAIAGSFMGIVIIIPLRKQLIEIERLRFPSGVAVATVLKSPGAGAEKARLLGYGFVVATGLTLLTSPVVGGWLGIEDSVIPDTLPIGSWIMNAFHIAPAGAAGIALLGTSLSLSFANLGAGLLSARGGIPFLLGGILAWWVIAPFVVGQGWAPDVTGAALRNVVYGNMLRPVGIGVLIGGALAGVVLAWPAIKGALKSLTAAARIARQAGGEMDELSPGVLGFGLVGSFVALLGVAILGSIDTHGTFHIGEALAIGVVATAWLGLAGLIVAQATGMTDISPLSGLALIAVTLMLAMSSGNVTLAVAIGVAVCIATSQCADMMTDLKTGHLVGGKPRRQQIVQFSVAWIGPAIAVGTVLLLWSGGPGGTGGFGPNSYACMHNQAGCLPAPQAGALQGMISGVLSGNAPVDKYVAGAVIGGSLAFFPIAGLGVLVGLAMYLPFEITLGYGIGCLISIGLQRWRGPHFYGERLVPIAAGLIVGEALTNLALTLITLAGG
ncbi:MAG TPA: OPT/YSL family transporter [Pseudomonadales bacterium]|nr:OPT/YSL family transporter [Pseudomonadales bacterium]